MINVKTSAWFPAWASQCYRAMFLEGWGHCLLIVPIRRGHFGLLQQAMASGKDSGGCLEALLR